MRIDLHSHTTRSDGSLAPAALVEEAARRKVGILAVTDHDTMAALPEAREAGARLGVRVVAGVELSCRDAAGEVHVLAFFREDPPVPFQELLVRQRDQRQSRAREMLLKLRAHGMELSWDDLVKGGASEHNVGRPHVARALMAKGYVPTFSEAFKRWLAPDRPAYVKHDVPLPEDGVRAVLAAGGVPVVAHPGHVREAATLDRMVAAGLLGMELYHPDHDAEKQARFSAFVQAHGLIATGGSDFHGAYSKRTALLGDHPTPPEQFARIEAAWR